MLRIPQFSCAAALAAGLLLAVPRLPAAINQDDAIASITAALRSGQFQTALELAQAAQRFSPKDVRVLVLEGMALTRLGQDDGALVVLRKAIGIAPDYVPAIEAAAEIEYRLDKPEAAARLKRLLTLRPAEPTAHAMLGAIAWKGGDCAAAVQHFRQAAATVNDQPDALREFGACLLKLKRPEDASRVFQQLTALQPDDPRARYSLAVSLMESTRFQDAIAVLDPLTKAAAPDPIALELASSAHESLGATPEAVTLLRQAVLLDPKNVNLYLDFAALSFAHQSFQVGVDMIAAGLTQVPDSAKMYLARGVLYVQLAQYAKADADFEKAEQLNPQRALGSVARGLSQIQQNNLDDALATIRSQLKTNPRDAFLYYVLAELLGRRGAQAGSAEFQQAIDAAREAVRLKPDFVLARDVLSRLYLQAGKREEAIEQCRIALRDSPDDEMALYRLIRALQSGGGPETAAEVPVLLKRFTSLREEARKRDAQAARYRLVEERPPAQDKIAR